MILDTIVERKKEEVAQLLRTGVTAPDCPVSPPRGFAAALTENQKIAVIAEAKKASPSKGIIRADFDPVAIGRAYERGGARAMSVLTDEHFFQGALGYIPQVRQAVALPVLRKDFLIHEVQVRQAHTYGADAILLIAAILDLHQLGDLKQQAEELGMDVLIEVHNELELEKTMAVNPGLVGINNRDLKTFTVDLETTFRLQQLLPAEVAVVSESGIRDAGDLRRLSDAGVAAALIGETLMRAPEPARMLEELLRH